MPTETGADLSDIVLWGLQRVDFYNVQNRNKWCTEMHIFFISFASIFQLA